jgi:phage-related protein
MAEGVAAEERQGIGKDLLRARWRWPVGRPLGSGLWEVRTDLPTKRTARVLLTLYRGHRVALHAFIKKTRATPDEDLAMARKRKKELEQ